MPPISSTVTVPFVSIPESLLRLASARDALKNAVATALARDASPIMETNDGLQRHSIFLPPALRARVQEKSETLKASFADTFAGLARAGIAIQAASVEASLYRVDNAKPAPFATKSAAQSAYWRNVSASLDAGRVVVAEGSTGLGKGRVIVAAALYRAEKGANPVYVVAPTLKIVGQLWGDLEQLRSENPGRWGVIKAAFLPGISEFADPLKIQEYLRNAQLVNDPNDPVDAAVQDWYERGGPLQDAGETPLRRGLIAAGHDVKMCFLMDDLRAIATSVEPASLALEDRDDERVAAAREAAANAAVVFCTHAMLGRLRQAKQTNQAPPQCLLVDEAHDFERNVAQVYSGAVALRAVRRGVVTGAVNNWISQTAANRARKALMAMEDEAISLSNHAEDQSADRISITADTPNTFWAAALVLHDTLKSKAFDKLPGIGKTRVALHDMLQFSKGKNTCWVEFSPKKAYPSIISGQSNIGGVLGALWKDAAQGVALCSATLLIPDASGNSRADYLHDVLALPRSRTDVPPSVVAPGILDIPVLHLPNKKEAAVLARPQKDKRTDDSEALWLKRLGKTVGRIVERKTIQGGTMVLLTSHRQVQALRAHIDPSRVVFQQDGERFSDAQKRFESAYRDGRKPVLLGVGAAWTGVDLTDRLTESENDFMLTDLIIGCLPVGLNRSATMQARIERTGTRPIEKEALMMLKQGLGRLIRRDGITGRHIWFLDGRLWTEWSGMEGFAAAGRKMLSAYKNMEGLVI